MATTSFSRGWTWTARGLAAAGILAALAAIVLDQVASFTSEARSLDCFGAQDSAGTLRLDHILIALPFLFLIGAQAISLRQPVRRAFIALDMAAVVLVVLYLVVIIPVAFDMPPAGDCAMDEWGDYGFLNMFALVFLMAPFALIYLGAAAVMWSGTYVARRERRRITGSPR